MIRSARVSARARALAALLPLLLAAPVLARPAQTSSAGGPQADDRTAGKADDRELPRPGDAGIGDPYFPMLGAGGYDVLHYDIRLEAEFEYDTIDALVRIDARALQALSSFNLDLVGLWVTAVEVDGEEAAFERDGRELTITPAEPIEDGAEFAVEIWYGGEPERAPDPTHAFEPGVGWERKDSGVYVTSECMGAASWFPCNDHPRDKASFTFTVTVPKPYVVAANGILVSQEDVDGDRTTFVFDAKSPMATYLATVNIAEFAVKVEEGPRGIPMRTWYPKDATDQELSQFARQRDIVEFFEQCFGPYPFESVGAIISYEFLGGALETQTAPVYSRGMPEIVVAHELAHQWFGDYVSTREWRHMWLNEGFASYAAHLWTEHAYGREAMERGLRRDYRMLRQGEIGAPAFPPAQELFSQRVYARGSWVLHRLRQEVGDDTFFAICKKWLADRAFGTGTTEEFTALCEELSGRDLDAFFAAELYGNELPVYPPFEETEAAEAPAGS